MRACKTCQHLKRPEIDRRLAAGEPLTRVAKDYGLTTVKRSIATVRIVERDYQRRGPWFAAMALLPSKETLGGAYFELARPD